MLKRKYETPLAEVITFRLEDVLTASPEGWSDGEPDNNGRGVNGIDLL